MTTKPRMVTTAVTAPGARRGAQVVDNRFEIRSKLGQGSFGDIFEVIDKRTGRIFACKLEPMNAKHPQLEWEILVYVAAHKSLPGKSLRPQGIPKVHATGRTRLTAKNKSHNYRYMVMDRLGKSLEDLYNLCDRRFSIKTICMIGIQLVSRIEHLHTYSYIHRDIKPDNFLIGAGSLQSKHAQVIHVIDFGLCKRVIDDSGKHIKYKEGKRLTGTPRYASINTHMGIEQSRRDDLESLGYMLIYFKRRKLPWQGLKAQTKQEKYARIGERKKATQLEQLCAGMPKQFIVYLKYVRGLKFDELPDYKYLRGIFIQAMAGEAGEIDWVFDWNKPLPGIPTQPAGPPVHVAHSKARRNVYANPATAPDSTPAGRSRGKLAVGSKRPRSGGNFEVVDLTAGGDADSPQTNHKRHRPNDSVNQLRRRTSDTPYGSGDIAAWQRAYTNMERERDKYKMKTDELQRENARLRRRLAEYDKKYSGSNQIPIPAKPPDGRRTHLKA